MLSFLIEHRLQFIRSSAVTCDESFFSFFLIPTRCDPRVTALFPTFTGSAEKTNGYGALFAAMTHHNHVSFFLPHVKKFAWSNQKWLDYF
jgi:hypothetical protein